MDKPSTPREWALYRVGLSCKIGRDAIEGKGPLNYSARIDYAIFNILNAIEDLARAMEEEKEK